MRARSVQTVAKSGPLYFHARPGTVEITKHIQRDTPCYNFLRTRSLHVQVNFCITRHIVCIERHFKLPMRHFISHASGLNMNSASGGSLTSVPNGRIIDFEVAELRKPPFQDDLYLWVRGTLPGIGFEARLAPRVYHDRPDYWGFLSSNLGRSVNRTLSTSDLRFSRVILRGEQRRLSIRVPGHVQRERRPLQDGVRVQRHSGQPGAHDG